MRRVMTLNRNSMIPMWVVSVPWIPEISMSMAPKHTLWMVHGYPIGGYVHVEIVGLCGARPIAQPQSARRKHLGTPKVDTKGVQYEYRVIQWSKNAPTFLPHPKDFDGPIPSHTKTWERLSTFLQLFNLFWRVFLLQNSEGQIHIGIVGFK